MTIAIIGASGFIGSALTKYLLKETPYNLVLYSHHAEELHFIPRYEPRITEINGDILKAPDIRDALKHCDIAIYLVHLMGNRQLGKKKFADAESTAAHNFAKAIKANTIRRVIYIGGMGKPSADVDSILTRHLQSRQQTGSIIRAQAAQLIEFRTPMVIGKGGAGYDVLRLLADRFPIFIAPRWANAVTQPITVNDVVRYIGAAVNLDSVEHISVDIGGPEQLSYVQIARRYATYKNKRLPVLSLPFIPKTLAATVLRMNKHHPSSITVADMIESAGYSTVIADNTAKKIFPAINPEPIERAF